MIDFDIIGISYYPLWSSVTLENIEATIRRFRAKYGKDIVIVETAYLWTLKWKDAAPNLAEKTSLVPGYPASKDGQRRYNIDLMQSVISGGGLGIVYWEPGWISTRCRTRWGLGSHAENEALFDYRRSELHQGADFLSHKYTPAEAGIDK